MPMQQFVLTDTNIHELPSGTKSFQNTTNVVLYYGFDSTDAMFKLEPWDIVMPVSGARVFVKASGTIEHYGDSDKKINIAVFL